MNQITFTFYLIYIVHSLVHPSTVPKVDTTNSENHISDQDPNILNLMVSHYDCAKQNNLRQFSLLNVEPCKQAPSDIQHTKTQATVYVRAKAKRIGIYSNAELDQFWNRVLFAKHSDTTLQLLGKSLSYDFISMHNEKHSYSGHNPYNHLRIGVHDHLVNLLPLF